MEPEKDFRWNLIYILFENRDIWHFPICDKVLSIASEDVQNELSRVRSLIGLFLNKPIPLDIDFEPAGDYPDMLSNLRATVLALPADA